MCKLCNFLPFSLAVSIQEKIWQCHAWVVGLWIWALRYRDCTVLKSYLKAVIYGVYKAPRPWRPSSLQAAASFSFLQRICNQAECTGEHCSYSHPAQSCFIFIFHNFSWQSCLETPLLFHVQYRISLAPGGLILPNSSCCCCICSCQKYRLWMSCLMWICAASFSMNLKQLQPQGGLWMQEGTEAPHRQRMRLPNKIKRLKRKHMFWNNRYSFKSNLCAVVLCAYENTWCMTWWVQLSCCVF